MSKRAEMAVYPGTFDPITNGHLDVIKRALKIFDKVVVAVADNQIKKTAFSLDERIDMLANVCEGLNVEVKPLHGLVVKFMKEHECHVMLRALRAVSDFDYEFQFAVINKKLDKKLETVFLMTDKEYFFLSSSVVRELWLSDGKVDCLVPEYVALKMEEKRAQTD